MKLTKKQQILFFGVIGLIASIGVGVGEFFLHYSPGGQGYDGVNFDFFNYISAERLTLGHFISISFMPLYFVGYYHLYLIYSDKNPKSAQAILILGIIAFVVGGMWISSRAQLGFLIHELTAHPGNTSLQVLLDKYLIHAEILVKSLRIWMAAISIIFVIPILKNKTIYPKWMALLNPILLLILVLVIYKLVPSIGYIIGPIAMNVVHFVLFSVSLIIIKNKMK